MLRKFFEKQVENYNYNKCVFLLQCIFVPFIMYGVINLLSFIKYAQANLIEIKVKLQNEIITNLDIVLRHKSYD